MRRQSVFYILCLVMHFFASCDDLFRGKKSPANARSGAVDLARGQKLYEEKCASCHGVLASSTKKQASLDRIQSAINSVPGMENLRALSTNELKSISAALNLEEDLKVEGARLYSANCASCHGILQKSQKLKASATQIKSAIISQPTMTNIKLNDKQIDAISAALIAVGSQSLAEAMPELRDRTMLASRLKRVFALTNQTDRSRLYGIIDTEILRQPAAFGGNCSRSEVGGEADSACVFKSGYEPYHAAGSMAKMQIIRSWRLDRACKSIAAQPTVAAFIAGRIGGSVQVAPTVENLTKFANLLSPGYETKSDGVKSTFSDLLRASSTYNAETQWRLMIYGVCGSLVTEKL